MAKLVYSNGAFTKSLSCIPPEAIDIDKPYIKVSGGGVIPLTTETHTGIKVNINGTPYSPASTVPVLYKTSVTETLSFYEGNIGTSGTSSISGTYFDAYISCNGQFSSVDRYDHDWYTTAKIYNDIFIEVNKNITVNDITYSNADSDRDVWKKSDGELYAGGRFGTKTFINTKIKFFPSSCSLLAINYVSRQFSTFPYIIISTSQSSKDGYLDPAVAFSYSDGESNTFTYTVGMQYNSIINSEYRTSLYMHTKRFTLGATSRKLYREGWRTSQSVTISYMTNFLKTTLGGYTNSLNSFSVKERNSTWISAKIEPPVVLNNEYKPYVPSFTIIGDKYNIVDPSLPKTATTLSSGFTERLSISIKDTYFYDKYLTNKSRFLNTTYSSNSFNFIGTLSHKEFLSSYVISGKITIGEWLTRSPFFNAAIEMQHVSSIENLHASAPNQFFYSTSSSQTTTSYTVVRSSIATIYN